MAIQHRPGIPRGYPPQPPNRQQSARGLVSGAASTEEIDPENAEPDRANEPDAEIGSADAAEPSVAARAEVEHAVPDAAVSKAPAKSAAPAARPAPIAAAALPALAPVAGLDLLTGDEAAAILRVSLQRLGAWRRKGIGPAFIKINYRTVHYRPADIAAFLAARHQPGTLA